MNHGGKRNLVGTIIPEPSVFRSSFMISPRLRWLTFPYTESSRSNAHISNVAQQALKLLVLLTKHLLHNQGSLPITSIIDSHLNHRVPALALEAVDDAVLAQTDGRELEEVTARDDLDPAEAALIPTDPSGHGFQLVEEAAIQHGYFYG